MSQRINIMLPKETQGKRSLREQLKAGYLEEEAWRTSRAGLRAKNKE